MCIVVHSARLVRAHADELVTVPSQLFLRQFPLSQSVPLCVSSQDGTDISSSSRRRPNESICTKLYPLVSNLLGDIVKLKLA